LSFELVLVKEGTYHTRGKEGRSKCFKILQYYAHYQSKLKILTSQMMLSASKQRPQQYEYTPQMANAGNRKKKQEKN
jgi:hypothetical protein